MLLDTYYATDGALPADKDELYRIARAMSPAERKAVDKIADQFFAVNGDGTRHNKRADEELHAYRAQADTNRIIAVERERRRREHEQSTNRATNDQPKPEARSQKDQKLLPSAEGFAEFWALWPKHFRKEARGQCEAVWRRKKLVVRSHEILEHVRRKLASAQWQDPQFIPAPLVYLNGEKWDGADNGPPTVKVDA